MFRTGATSLVVLALLAVGFVTVIAGGNSAAKLASTRNADTATTPAASRITAPSAALHASSRNATVTSTDYRFSASVIDAPAGKLKLTLDNAGAIAHELVVLRTSANPASLKVAGSGRVSETASVGEVSEIESGMSKSTTFDLEPGRYVYVCNIPGHYANGMRGVLVVR